MLDIDYLIAEIKNNEYKKDILSDNSLEFSGEYQAMYFSNLRKNMTSDIAHTIMYAHQQLDDLTIIKNLEIKI